MGQETRYAEILLVIAVAALATWNYMHTVDNFVLPHKVAMYSVKPVLQHDRYFSGFDEVNSAARTKKFHDVVFDAAFVPVARSGDFNFHYMTPIMISKVILGCYGNHSVGDEVLCYACDLPPSVSAHPCEASAVSAHPCAH